MKSLIHLFVFISVLGFNNQSTSNDTDAVKGDLLITVEGLKNQKGQIGILLFNKKEGFPSNKEMALKEILLPIEGNTLQYSFKNLPFGDYAVTVMHDENKNKKLDTNLLGIPKEGNGVSNNVVNKLGPPKFKKALFTLDQEQYSINIKVKYRNK